jgi:hypothetical protein
MAMIAELKGSSGAKVWWRKAYDVLSGMGHRGLFISQEDQQSLAKLIQKLSDQV